MSDKILEMKGSLYTLSALRLLDNDCQKFALALSQKIAQAPGFFVHAPVVLDVTALAGQAIDFIAFKQCINDQNMVLVGVSGADNEQKEAAAAAGIASLLTSTKPQPKSVGQTPRAAQTPPPASSPAATKIIDGTVRSGQQVYAKNADLIVMGAVSNGAEVIADGNIHIYGTLRGRAIAGAAGNTNARIFCHNIQAELVSICGHYWLSDALQETNWQQAVCIKLDDEKLVIKPLA